MADPTLPEAEYLRECFSYDPASGRLTWRERPRYHFLSDKGWKISQKYAGTIAGERPSNKGGYLRVNINNVVYFSHRVIWKMVTGEEHETIDHRNLNRTENWWDNLRPSFYGQNNANSKVRSNSKTGVKGVRKVRNGKFAARVRKDGVTIHLGTFRTTSEAHAAYCKAAEALHGEFFNPG